jgi:hypothetical protein
VRAAFLRQVAEDGGPPLVSALRQLTGKENAGLVGAGTRAAAVALDRRQRGEVEGFAACFFALAPAERRQQWQDLMQRCRFSEAARQRLADLEPGLKVVVPEGGDLQVLAGRLTEVFTTAPPRQAAVRARLVADLRAEQPRWQAAGKQLARQSTVLTRLEPEALHQLGVPGFARKPPSQPAPAGRPTGGGAPAGSKASPFLILFLVVSVIRILAVFANSGPARQDPVLRPTIPWIPVATGRDRSAPRATAGAPFREGTAQEWIEFFQEEGRQPPSSRSGDSRDLFQRFREWQQGRAQASAGAANQEAPP